MQPSLAVLITIHYEKLWFRAPAEYRIITLPVLRRLFEPKCLRMNDSRCSSLQPDFGPLKVILVCPFNANLQRNFRLPSHRPQLVAIEQFSGRSIRF